MRYIWILLFLFSAVSADTLDTENRRLQQENLRKLQDNFKPQSQTPQTQEIQEENIIFKTPISQIFVSQNTILSKNTINNWISKYENKITDLYALDVALKELENIYLDKGYITTRVRIDLANSDTKIGKLSVVVLEGKVEKYLFDGKEKPIKSFVTFPKRSNLILNLKDIDQGTENLSNMSKIDIIPSDKFNHSIVDINTTHHKTISGSINYNNLGSATTGKHRYRLSLNLNDLLGINENIFAYYQERLARHKSTKNSQNYMINTSFPIKYYELGYAFEHSNYKQGLYGINRIYIANGTTNTHKFDISRVLYRNGDSKLSIKNNLALKNIQNYIDEQKMITSSRKLSVFGVSLAYMTRAFNGLSNFQVAAYYGLDAFGANKDDEWYRTNTSPKAKFDKYNFDFSWYKPLNLINYRLNFSSQYSNDILYSNEKISVGDDTTVRGFRDNGILGDKGFYMRNEIELNAFNIFRPFVGYDIAKAKNNKETSTPKYGQTLQGFSLGGKFAFKNIESVLSISKATDYPQFTQVNSHEIYATISCNF